MSTSAFGRKVVAGVALLLAVLCAGPGWGQGKPPVTKDKDKPTIKPKPPAPPPEAVEVQVFKLKHAQPREVQQLLTNNWTALAAAHGQGAAKAPSIAVNDRTATLFARGSEKALAVLQGIIPALDDALGGKGNEDKDGRVIRLKNVSVHEANQILTGLGLQNAVIGMPQARALFLVTNDKQAKDVRLVIEKLDAGEPARVTKTPPSKDKPIKKGPGKDKR